MLLSLLGSFAFVVLAVLSVRGLRWAYMTFVLMGLLYFPVKVGFRFDPQPCELTFSVPLAIHSLTNYAHIVLFALFFVMSIAQFRMSNRSAFAWAALATIVMGALVEVEEGLTNLGHCRSRDLIPDAVGILAGSVIVLLFNRIRRRPEPGESGRVTTGTR